MFAIRALRRDMFFFSFSYTAALRMRKLLRKHLSTLGLVI